MGLDTVELVMAIEDAFSVTIDDAEGERLETPAGVIAWLVEKLDATDEIAGVCPTMRAFHRVRHAALAATGTSRRALTPRTSVAVLFPRGEDGVRWSAFEAACRLPSMPKPCGWLGLPGAYKTLGDLSRWAVCRHTRELRLPGERWTRQEIRAVVRALVTEHLSVVNFADDDEFVRDLGAG